MLRGEKKVFSQLLELTETPQWWSVRYLFVELLRQVFEVGLPRFSPPFFQIWQDLQNLRSCLNLRRLHTWRLVPYSFVQLRR
jgi:hypothetical protein